MAQYQEQTVQGQSWQRCFNIIIDNPLGGPAMIKFYEERVTVLGQETIKSNAGLLTRKFNPQEVVSLRNSQTGELTGEQLTHLDIYNILYSLYMQTALQRDGVITDPQYVPGREGGWPTN
jgi:hypothetical protein